MLQKHDLAQLKQESLVSLHLLLYTINGLPPCVVIGIVWLSDGGCMRHVCLVSVLPAVDDGQLALCLEKWHDSAAGNRAWYDVNSTNSNMS